MTQSPHLSRPESLSDFPERLFTAERILRFAQRPEGSRFFRAQHDALRVHLQRLVAGAESEEFFALTGHLRTQLTDLGQHLQVHQEFEGSQFRQALATDPRARAHAEKCDREVAAAVAEITSLQRRFPCPSDWTTNRGPINAALRSISDVLNAVFVTEERHVFPAFDRSLAVTAQIAEPAETSPA